MKKHILLLFIALLILNGLWATPLSDTVYREFPVTLHTPTADIHGTLTLPVTMAKKTPVCLIISGSGPTDRDGNNPYMRNESLKLFAHALADSGIASLRYDKRGIAESVVKDFNESTLRFEDYIHDAESWIDQLKKDNRFNRVIVAGHSEGSLIGMIASLHRADGFISLAGLGRTADKAIQDQINASSIIYGNQTKSILDSLNDGQLVKNIPPQLLSLFRPSIQPYLMSWFKYDPAKELAKLHIPVLIIQGDQDLQVTVEDAKKLKLSDPEAEEYIIPNMNHVLKKVSSEYSDNISSYSDPHRPLDSDLMAPVVHFIRSIHP